MITVIDNYDSFTYNLVQYLGELGAEPSVYRNDAVTVDELRKMRPERIVISPGPGTPDNAGISLAVVTAFAGSVPILGVCLGHQAVGQAFGGRVVSAPELMHGKTSRIIHHGTALYRGIESPLVATRYHSLVVDPRTLPSCLTVTAETADGVIMGLEHAEYQVYGVQFHPESIMTDCGKRLLENFLNG